MNRPLTAIIGSGNLAWHLAGVLGEDRVVVSRTAQSDLPWPVPKLSYAALQNHRIRSVFLAVPDNFIREVSAKLAKVLPPTVPVFHTSGATPISGIDTYFDHRGVLWPIRSLRLGEVVASWREVPLVIYANDPVGRSYLEAMAGRLSDKVAWLDDRQRAQLHLSAVFSNNFATALYEISYQLCQEYDIPFDLLLPIIRHTAGSLDGKRPAIRQTGAAARNDTATMQRHLDLLSRPEYQDLYRAMSRLILEYRLPQNDPDLRRDAYDNFEDEGIA